MTIEQESALRRPEVAVALRDELVACGARRVILMGVPSAMEEPYLKAPVIRAGIMVFTPPAAARTWLREVTREKPAPSSYSPDVIAAFRALVADGAEHGIDHLVIASRELMDLVCQSFLELPVVDVLRVGSLAIRNVVFDMGGVLLKWDPLGMARRVSESEDDARLLSDAVFGSQEWALQDAGAVDDATVSWTSKLRVPQRLHESVDRLVYHWHDDREFMPQTGELIRELKAEGYGIYLLSNAGVAFEQYKRQLPAFDCFDGMVVSCFEHVVKPDARIYRILCERYGINPTSCLFVDDVECNVQGARRVGMRGWRFDGSVDILRYHLLGR